MICLMVKYLPGRAGFAFKKEGTRQESEEGKENAKIPEQDTMQKL